MSGWGGVLLCVGLARAGEASLPAPPSWPMPSDAEVSATALEVSRQSGGCARAPAPRCALELARLRGALTLAHAERGTPDEAAVVLSEVLSAGPGEGDQAQPWVELFEDLAARLEALGSLELARSVRLAELAALPAAGSPQTRLRALVALAALEQELDRSEDAAAHAAEALTLAGGTGAEAASARLVLGRAALTRYDYLEARAQLDAALSARLLLYGARSREVGEARLWLGALVGVQRDLLLGQQELQLALELLDGAPGAASLAARCRVELARALRNAGDPEGAAAAAREGIERLREAGSRDRLAWASLWAALAIDLRRGDAPDAALTLDTLALAELKRAGLEGTLRAALLLQQLASLQLSARQLDAAIRNYQSATDQITALLGERAWAAGTARLGLATAEARAGQAEAARQDALLALQIHSDAVGIYLDGVSERVGLTWISQADTALSRALSLVTAQEDTPALWSATMAWRGAVGAAARRRHQAARAVPEQAETLQALLDLRRALAAEVIGREPTRSEARRQRVHQLLIEKDALERQLARSAPTALSSMVDVDLRQICEALPADQALVQLVRYERLAIPRRPNEPAVADAWLAFVAPPGGCDHPVRVELGPAAPIDAAANAWTRDLEAAHRGSGVAAAASREGASLRRLLWDPISRALGGAAQVYLVADGHLGVLPWAALPLEGGALLVERVGISTLDNPRDLLGWSKPRPTPSGTAAVIGDIFYSNHLISKYSRGSVEGAGPVSPGCAPPALPLPWTRRELRHVSRHLERMGLAVTRSRGRAATVESISALAPRVSILHVAAHGFTRGPGCGPGDTEVPSARTGLALAGGDEGLWSAEEIAGLDLSGVALAVLSACATGLGDLHDDDGALSLRRALLIAGAREVIYTVGPVPDPSAARLMDRLYGQLARGASPAEALVGAQRQLLAEQREEGTIDAAAWAWFSVTGAWGALSGDPR